jgi:deoxyhypusine synthase
VAVNESEKIKIRRELLREPVTDIRLADIAEASEKLMEKYKQMGGFSVKYLVRAADILVDAITTSSKIALAFPANLVSTGLRGIIADMVNKGICELLMTTGGTFDHDIARGTGNNYYIGEFAMDDVFLKELEIHRLGNILIPVENYGPPIERFVHEMLEELIKIKDTWTTSELAHESGKRLRDESSILRAVYERNKLLFAPGVLDSAFGTAIFTFNEEQRLRPNAKQIKLDLLEDERKISEYIYSVDNLTGIILGGGISKHHLIWWSQFRGGLDYAVQITSAPEWDGSLSGAQTREAISWGKIKPQAKHVTVPGDVTILFPLLMGYVAKKTGVA